MESIDASQTVHSRDGSPTELVSPTDTTITTITTTQDSQRQGETESKNDQDNDADAIDGIQQDVNEYHSARFRQEYHERHLRRSWESVCHRSTASIHPYDGEKAYKIVKLAWDWIKRQPTTEPVPLHTIPPYSMKMPKLGEPWELGYCPLRKFLKEFPRMYQVLPVYQALPTQRSIQGLLQVMPDVVGTGIQLSCSLPSEQYRPETPPENLYDLKFWLHNIFHYALAVPRSSYWELLSAELAHKLAAADPKLFTPEVASAMTRGYAFRNDFLEEDITQYRVFTRRSGEMRPPVKEVRKRLDGGFWTADALSRGAPSYDNAISPRQSVARLMSEEMDAAMHKRGWSVPASPCTPTSSGTRRTRSTSRDPGSGANTILDLMKRVHLTQSDRAVPNPGAASKDDTCRHSTSMRRLGTWQAEQAVEINGVAC